MLDMVVGLLGQADTPGRGQALEARGDIHRLAQHVPVLRNHLADMDADPKHEPQVGRLRLSALRHRSLDVDRAGDGIGGAREFEQRAITHQLHAAAVVAAGGRLDDLLPLRLDGRERTGLVALHQAAVADHVGHEDRCQPTFHAGLRGRAPRCIPRCRA